MHSLVLETDIDNDDTARDGPRTWREGHGPLVPGIKRKAKPSSSDKEGSESTLAEESWGGISPTSEESEDSRLRHLASSQSLMHRVKKRVNLNIPSQCEGVCDKYTYIVSIFINCYTFQQLLSLRMMAWRSIVMRALSGKKSEVRFELVN